MPGKYFAKSITATMCQSFAVFIIAQFWALYLHLSSLLHLDRHVEWPRLLVQSLTIAAMRKQAQQNLGDLHYTVGNEQIQLKQAKCPQVNFSPL